MIFQLTKGNDGPNTTHWRQVDNLAEACDDLKGFGSDSNLILKFNKWTNKSVQWNLVQEFLESCTWGSNRIWCIRVSTITLKLTKSRIKSKFNCSLIKVDIATYNDTFKSFHFSCIFELYLWLWDQLGTLLVLFSSLFLLFISYLLFSSLLLLFSSLLFSSLFPLLLWLVIAAAALFLLHWWQTGWNWPN